MKLLSKEELVAIRMRAELALPAPWKYHETTKRILCGDFVIADVRGGHEPDGYFIVATRTDIPALLADIEQYQNKLSAAIDDIYRASYGLCFVCANQPKDYRDRRCSINPYNGSGLTFCPDWQWRGTKKEVSDVGRS